MLPTASAKFAGLFNPPSPMTPPINPVEQPRSARSMIEETLAGYNKLSPGKAAIGAALDALAQFGGFRGSFGAQQAEQREQQSMLQNLLLKSQMEDERSAANRAAGNDDWKMRQQWELDNRPDPTPVAVAKAAGLQPGSPAWQQALTAAIPGYSNTQPVLDARAQVQKDIAEFRAAQARQTKAMPTYAQANPRPKGGGRSGGGKPPKLPTGFILD